ncbi:MAG: hypothetical protein R3B49_10050 [Phycisphaerales bacterium]
MEAIAYTVRATVPSAGVAEEYVGWLVGGHVAAVVRGGAESGEVVRVSDPAEPIVVEVRYRFPDRGAFDRYEREHAPALRAEGRARFGPERGIVFERTIGTILGAGGS